MITPEELNFIETVAPAAQNAAARYGVPASVTIAQAILESSWGKSLLARLASNFFGIKHNAHNAGELYIEMQTKEFVNGSAEILPAEFVRYANATDSFNDHGSLLATAPRYSPAMKDANDPFEFAAQLRACGYSTDAAYAAKLGALITQFKLLQYDKPKDPPAADAVAA